MTDDKKTMKVDWKVEPEIKNPEKIHCSHLHIEYRVCCIEEGTIDRETNENKPIAVDKKNIEHDWSTAYYQCMDCKEEIINLSDLGIDPEEIE